MSYFIETLANILGNEKLRKPQKEAYIKIYEFFQDNPSGEALVVLPTGTGKSGLISIAPFGTCNGRVLIITPGLVTKRSIEKTQELLDDNFWINYDVLFSIKDIPVINEYSSDLSDEHLFSSQIVYSNIQKLGKSREHGLLNRVQPDFFDMIIVDESHHAPAEMWREVLSYFPNAKKLYVTGTPYRGDKQELPGTKIHETPLSEVMRDRYVKWLRKETVNAHELYFTIPDTPDRKFTKEEVLQLRDKEWLERSVALSKECSMDVIKYSVKKLKELKEASPNVPHKILAAGCSIQHAEDLAKWYQSLGVSTVIVHSEMSKDEIQNSFDAIDRNECEAVISVNMLMEGYDHRYLSILAVFRPYRSINAFAQIIGRILRAIPEEEITSFEIDNNALVIYHEETGLDTMWQEFQGEVDRGKKQKVRDYPNLESEYEHRGERLADISSGDTFISDHDSYLDDINFNALFEQKRAEINKTVASKIQRIQELSDSELDQEDLDIIEAQFTRKETQRVAKKFIDPTLIAKRPDKARKEMRNILTQNARNQATDILSDYNLDEKGVELATLFISKGIRLPQLTIDTPNNGVIVTYINVKLFKKFGPAKDRDNDKLVQSINHIPVIAEEVRSML